MVDQNFFHINKPLTLDYIANLVKGKIVISQNNNFDVKLLYISGINSIKDAKNDEIVILSNIKYQIFLSSTKALACIVDKNYNINNYPAINFIVVENTKYALALISDLFYSIKPSSKDTNLIHNNSTIGRNCFIGFNVIIEENVNIGDNVHIDHNSVIKYGVKIGNNVTIGSNVSISFSVIGNNVNILPGAKIGQEGFGFATYNNTHYKILHTGRVIIGNNVEIGANTTIDRGSNAQDTVIEDNVMIDNLVQIAHNVSIGKGSVLVAQVGVAGSSKLGNYCLIGGQAGVAGHLQIGNYVQIAGQAAVLKNLEDNQKVIGSPAINKYDWYRQNLKLKNL